MSPAFFIQPVLAGLSVGGFCLSYCFPFLASFMAAQQRQAQTNWLLILYFMLGRLLGYILFGLTFSYLGEKLQLPFLNIATNLALIFISIILILYLVGLIKEGQENCLMKRFQNKNAFVMGFLMGINICPPFLMSLTYVFSLHSTLGGLYYFLIFFIASSVYFLPLFFVGLLAKMKEFRWVARASGLLCSAIFIVYGIYSLGRGLYVWR